MGVCAGQLRGRPVRSRKALPDAQPIAVPASYNDQNDQTTALRRHYGWAWYQRKVTLPTFCAGQRVVLRFGSVTHTAKVWLNGQLIAQHKGGFTPLKQTSPPCCAPARRCC